MSEPEPVAYREAVDFRYASSGYHYRGNFRTRSEEHGNSEPLYTHAQLTAATTAARAEGAREALEGAAREQRENFHAIALLVAQAGGEVRITPDTAADLSSTATVESWRDPKTGEHVVRLSDLDRTRAAQLGQDADRG